MELHATDATVASLASFSRSELAAETYLARYKGQTATDYRSVLKRYFAWCYSHGLEPLDAQRAHLELFCRDAEAGVGMPKPWQQSTMAHRVTVICGYYRFAHLDGMIPTDPSVHLKRPKWPSESTSNYLNRTEMRDVLAVAKSMGTQPYALGMLLGLNGLRISEALGIDVEHITTWESYPVINIIGKGNKPAKVPLSVPTYVAVHTLAEERGEGPLFLSRTGGRMSRQSANFLIQQMVKKAGITKRVTPHSFRHSFITNALECNVPMRDVQHSARHASPATTTRYDRKRDSIARNATHVLTAFIGGVD